MSELNVYHHELRHNEYAEFYLKSEADKVIAEKDKEIADLIEKNKRLANKDIIMASETIKDLFKELRHSNHKRCLAMAQWCFDEGKGTPTVYEVRTFYWGRWGNIWLALAEEPTWAKFLQLIHKEAK